MLRPFICLGKILLKKSLIWSIGGVMLTGEGEVQGN